jgi:hypothetical protein
MWIIFGWGRERVKNYGPTLKRLCNHCNNEDFGVLKSITTWFTLFFIPVLPYAKETRLVCPVCNHGREIDKAEFNRMLSLARLHPSFSQRRITEAQDQQKSAFLDPGRRPSPAKQPPMENRGLNQAAPVSGPAISFCGNCGKQLDPDANFCKYCGNKI